MTKEEKINLLNLSRESKRVEDVCISIRLNNCCDDEKLISAQSDCNFIMNNILPVKIGKEIIIEKECYNNKLGTLETETKLLINDISFKVNLTPFGTTLYQYIEGQHVQ